MAEARTPEPRPASSESSVPGFRRDDSGDIPCLRFPLIEAVPGVRHAITTRLGDVSFGPYATMNLGLSFGDDRETVLANRTRAAALVADAGTHPVTVRQVHGVTSALATEAGEPGLPIAEADLLATNRPGIVLMVQAADCVPVIVIDPARLAVAVVHSGWRGTAASAGREAVASMQRLFGSRPEDLLVGVGPGIGICCYEVSDEVAEAVAASIRPGPERFVDRSRGERPYVDLAAIFSQQLLDAGVNEDRIARVDLCTACNLDLFYSHRREGVPTGRFGALVAIDEPGAQDRAHGQGLRPI